MQTQAPAHDPGITDAWLSDWLSQTDEDHERLLSASRAVSMTFGTGFDILSAACDFILAHVESELIFVTCFWARSDSLTNVADLLSALSAKALSKGRKIRVRICVSSTSIVQKLFHTWSPRGKIYGPSQWVPKFQIPPQHKLTGLDLQIKSVFIPPFSVMHSKFIVIDKKACLLPSCNVSWENWFEGCVDLRGPIVDVFVEYWETFWGRNDRNFSLSRSPLSNSAVRENLHVDGMSLESQPGSNEQDISQDGMPPFAVEQSNRTSFQAGMLPMSLSLLPEDVRVTFLPSPYHQNPRFRPFPWQRPPHCPRTPLNTFTLQLLEGAKKSILLQTPNVTSPPVLAALVRALGRGINVHIVTNERLMRLEQIATAGTTTPRCLKKLISSYQKLLEASKSRRDVDGGEATVPPGRLRIEFFASSEGHYSSNSWPVSSHLKLTVVDTRVVILGSGNMDRASWFTSQELGVALISETIAERIVTTRTDAVKDRVHCIYGDFE